MLISYQKSSRGKDVVIDKNKFKYTNNGNKNGSVNYWRCSNRGCSARILTRKSTGELVSELPTHEHSNKLMKQAAKEIETELIKSYAKVDGSTSKQVLLEISNNVMGSNSPGLLSSVSSAGAVKMALLRERQKINPRPNLPKSHDSFMSMDIPEKYSQTADGSEFILKKCWVDEEETIRAQQLEKKLYCLMFLYYILAIFAHEHNN